MFHRPCHIISRSTWTPRPKFRLPLSSRNPYWSDNLTPAVDGDDGEEGRPPVSQTSRGALNGLLARLRGHNSLNNKPRIIYTAVRNANRSDLRQIPPEPEHWSASGLTKYVLDLTKVHLSRKNEIFRLLLSVLQDNASRSYLTLEAFKLALSYAYRHSNHRLARQLYRRVQDLNMLGDESGPDDEVTEIILWGSGATGDIKAYIQILNNHLDHNGSLTPGIWLTLLRIAPLEHDRHIIWNTMKQQGMLKDIRTLRKSVILTVQEIFEAHLRSGKDYLSFLQATDEAHRTSDWLTPVAANIMLCSINRSSHHGPTAAFSMLKYMQTAYALAPRLDTLNTMIHWPPTVKMPNKTASHISVDILRHFDENLSIKPRIEAFDTLFNRFYRRRYYNSVKVLWQAACISGATTTKMSNAISSSIIQSNIEPPAEPKHAYANTFRFAVGKVAAGICGNDQVPSDISSHGTTTVYHDTRKFRTFQLRCGLPDLLENAIQMDERWIEEQVWQDKGLEWMRQNAIPVEIVPP